MSEYQYYEFRAVDRPLSGAEISQLRQFSKRAEITPFSFVNYYDYGNFRGDPVKLVEKYFDAFLYIANWGTRWLMFRIPKKLVDQSVLEAYRGSYAFTYHIHNNDLILSFQAEDESPEWEEGQGVLDSLLPVRAELMRGDERILYLAWLLAIDVEDHFLAAPEPPVPPGLGELDAPIANFVDFLRIDADLIEAAAENSSARSDATLSDSVVADWISNLSPEERDALLAKLVLGDDIHLVLELRRRALTQRHDVRQKALARRRTGAELLERAESIREDRLKREAAERDRRTAGEVRQAAERRKVRLESLRGREESLWTGVRELIGTRQPRRYDEAVLLLRDLRDLAGMDEKSAEFALRMSELHAELERKPTLITRLRNAGLIG